MALKTINVRPSLPSWIFPFRLNVFSFSKWRTNIICVIFWTYHNGTFCLRRRSPGTTHTFWNVTALWNKSCSIKRWTVHPCAWCASFVIALNPFVCVHTQHTDSIKLLFIHNSPPMMLGSPTTPATANQFINMTSSSNPVQQLKTTSASRSNLPGMYSWQNPQVYYDF